MSRNVKIVLAVLLLHGGALWALQSGLLRKVAELVVPAEILVEMAAPEAAQPEKPTPVPVPVAAQVPQARPITPTTPTTLAVQETTPSATELASVAASTTVATAHTAASTQANAPTAQAAPAPAALVLPSSDADYLNNPRPPYPPMSKRLREQGKVVVRTLIGVDGAAQQAEIKQSSGFDRLDQAALATALRWRYVPGKRAGVAETMWFNLPFTFVLE
ncbi:MAG: energy transducer TonB [Burkholderiales bacterium]|nr:energy transducer TonB [Burkholderiales bacterium]